MNTESKHVYFFRHGESVANATKVRQGPETPLTDKGQVQASKLGERLVSINLERILSSSFLRARKTAEIVTVHTLHENIDLSPLYAERRNPSIMVGAADEDEAQRQIWEQIGANYGNPGWRHSDEENFEDLIFRAKEGLKLLETLPEKRVGVASHGLFMKVIFAHVLLGDMLDGRIFWDKFVPMKGVENTGIMHLEYTMNYHRTKMYWKLVSWNDHAHLN